MTTTRTDAAAQTDLALNSAASVASLYTDTLDLTDWRELDDDALGCLLLGLDTTSLDMADVFWLVDHRHAAVCEATIDLLVREAVG